MSARDDLIEIVTSSPESSGGDVVWATDLVDAYRAEAIGHAIARLYAIPVDCTALTGPVWYGAGWKDCITQLEEIAEYRLPEGEAYPGELQRLRARMRELRAAALRQEDLGRVQQVLMTHATYEAEIASKAADATPDFFEPGRTYRWTDVWTFRCVEVAAHPETGARTAVGWWRTGEGPWQVHEYADVHWSVHWVDVTEAGDGS